MPNMHWLPMDIPPSAEQQGTLLKVVDSADGSQWFYFPAVDGLVKRTRDGSWFAADWVPAPEPVAPSGGMDDNTAFVIFIALLVAVLVALALLGTRGH